MLSKTVYQLIFDLSLQSQIGPDKITPGMKGDNAFQWEWYYEQTNIFHKERIILQSPKILE